MFQYKVMISMNGLVLVLPYLLEDTENDVFICLYLSKSGLH